MPDLLADEFADLPTKTRLCPLGVVLEEASDVARVRLNEALRNVDDVPISWIVERLRKAGRPCGKETVGAHRNGRCRCVQGR
jgi:hypothetical protein